MRQIALFATLGLLVVSSECFAGSLSGTVTATGKRTNADAVVYVDEIPGTMFSTPAEHAKMDQIRRVFAPHVLPVLVGTTVDFRNSDPLAHNVFAVDECADMFDLGTWTKGEVRSYTFDGPCAAVILCNVHPEMEAYVVAVPTPYFSVTEDSGSYIIEAVPDGTYTVRVWHPQLKEVSQAVTVQGSTTANFVLKK